MIEIRVTKELGNYEPKLVGPLTIRQVICLIIGLPCCYLIYRVLSPVMTKDIAGFFCMIPAAVAGAFGWAKPYGMKTEKFIKATFVNMVLAPSNRRYKTKNVHETGFKVLNELAISEDFNSDDFGDENLNKQKKKKETKRYKLSSKAFK